MSTSSFAVRALILGVALLSASPAAMSAGDVVIHAGRLIDGVSKTVRD